MKAFGKWIGKIIGSALVLVLVIVLLPYASRWISRIMPDGSLNAVTVSAVLSRNMQASSRLETARVDDEGVISSAVNALLIGEVQNVVIQYRYEASLGIDLTKVQIHLNGNTLTMEIPPLEVLADSLTPINVERNDFWFPLTESRRKKLLEEELSNCRAYYLASNEESQTAFEHTVEAVTAWVDQLLNGVARQGVTIQCIQQEQST